MNGPSEQTNLLYDTTFLSFWPAFELMSQFAGGGNWETVCGWLLSHWGPISTYIFTYQSHNLLLPSSPIKTSRQTLCAYLSFIIIASVCLFTRTQSQLLCM